jgi:hypothetical protein
VAVEAGHLSNSIAHGWQPIGALHVRETLAAGESKKIIFVLGYREPAAGSSIPRLAVINKQTVLPVIRPTILFVERPFCSSRPIGTACQIPGPPDEPSRAW